MTDAAATKPTINIEGVPYEIDSLSDRVKQLLVIHQRWEKDAADQRLDLAKSEAATRDLTREIVELVKTENVSQVAPQEAV